MRIVAGAWRGRALAAPPGETTRPTADRVRQALFDRLMHAPWAGRALMEGAIVLDAFAGTGALGLEALSRGAAHAHFLEQHPAALQALRANIAACRAEPRATVHRANSLRPPPGQPCTLLFLDPPYHQELATPALLALRTAGWVAPGAILLLETARGEDPPPLGDALAHFAAGPAQIHAFLLPSSPSPIGRGSG